MIIWEQSILLLEQIQYKTNYVSSTTNNKDTLWFQWLRASPNSQRMTVKTDTTSVFLLQKSNGNQNSSRWKLSSQNRRELELARSITTVHTYIDWMYFQYTYSKITFMLCMHMEWYCHYIGIMFSEGVPG